MNVDTVETITGGIDADDLDFDTIVDEWHRYAQDTWRVKDGKIYSNVNYQLDKKSGWWGTGLFSVDEKGALTNADNLEADFTMVSANGDAEYGKYFTGLHEGFAFNVTMNADKTLSGYFISNGHHNVVWDPNTSWTGKDKELDYDLRILWRFDGMNLDNIFTTDTKYDFGLLGCAQHGKRKVDLWHTLGDTMTSGQGGTVTNLGMWYDSGKNVEYKVKFKDNRIQIWNTQAGSQARYANTVNLNKRNADVFNGFRKLPSWDKTGEYYDDKGVYHGADDSEACLDITQSADEQSVTYHDNLIGEDIVTLYNSAAGYNAHKPTTDQYGTPKFSGSTYGKPISSGSYGFWGANCEQNGSLQINNMKVSISKQVVKSFGDIVYEPSWTDGALHMLINIDTKADKTMLGNDGVAWLLYRCNSRW